MADRDAHMEQYSYRAMSSKVEQQQQSGKRRGRRGGDPTGHVESLSSSTTTMGRMGDLVPRVNHKRPAPIVSSSSLPPQEEPSWKRPMSIHNNSTNSTSTTNNILSVPLQVYQPTTPASQEAYAELLQWLSHTLQLSGDDVLRDAAHQVLTVLWNNNKHNTEQELTSLLGISSLTKAHHAKLVQWSKTMSDFQTTMNRMETKQEEEEQGLQPEGVAVVFEEQDDDDDDQDSEGLVAAIPDSESESDKEEEEGPTPLLPLDDEEMQPLKTASASTTTTTSTHPVSTVSVQQVDAHYLQRLVPAEHDKQAMAHDIWHLLGHAQSDRHCENQLLVWLGLTHFQTIQRLVHNRWRIYAAIALKKQYKTLQQVQDELQAADQQSVWNELTSVQTVQEWSRERFQGLAKQLQKDKVEPEEDASPHTPAMEERTTLDLDALHVPHHHKNNTCSLPPTSWRAVHKGYEEVHVPAVRSVVPHDEVLVDIQTDLPDWTHAAFSNMDKLNRVQSKLCTVALQSSENILLCAPTGAGKTNVAMLTMLNILGQYRKQTNNNDCTTTPQDDDEQEEKEHKGNYDLDKFKMVYIAPMKALVQEVVKNFSNRLKDYGVVVRELSGDSSLTRQQIAETQLIVTTPEKWDIVTRQGEERAYTQLVKLVIVDEIHLLADERGPVLESIVARVIRQVETTAEPIRLVGLSATLPNYVDVATFLRVNPNKGLFFFDHSYRPVPLQMQYIGLTERNAFKRVQMQNEICYDRALTQRRNNQQILIFVHSRAETAKTAKALRDLALERDDASRFCRDGSATQEILKEEAVSVKNQDLKDFLPFGFAIHHAGMAREDRELVEDLFADKHIAVLCTTATLAWGVNLPAHAVIIKGTQIYDPAKGDWAELSPLDIMQMLGRAGRPQYDTEGEGIILTKHSELQFYLSLTNLQLPVESQLIKTLPNHLNAEIVLGTVQNIEEAADWLSYTFLYVRMLRNPSLYGINDAEATLKSDPTLKKRRLDLAHTAATILEKSLLVQYDRRSGSLRSTALGRVASQYYIGHSSMAVYSRHMRPNMSDIELLRLFSMSGEFEHITVRQEEQLELSKLAGKVPIPIKESPSEPLAKVNILLQAYISRLKLDGFALQADMAFVQQSAARIMRALFEIATKRNWSSLARLTLDFANMIAHRIWRSQTPLRQFPSVPEVVARKLERKGDIEWSRYSDLSSNDLGELVGVPKMGKILHELVHKFPRLDVSAVIQPITRSLLRVELTLISAFEFDIDVHGYSQLFHIMLEDVNGENILYYQSFTLKRSAQEDEHVIMMTVPIMDPLPPAYFIRVISDRWLHSESMLPISFNKTILPSKFPPPTELLDLQPLPVSTLGEAVFVKLFPFKEFNPIQTQSFHEIFKTSRNAIICAPSGSGLKVLADLAILRSLQTQPDGKCVYVCPMEEVTDQTYKDWKRRFGSLLGPSQIIQLTGEAATDLILIAAAKIVVATTIQWDSLTRRWRQRKALHDTSLVIFDELHLIGGERGPTLEVVVSRMRYISSERRDSPIRLIGLGASLANAREVGEWMGVPEKSLFNFSPKNRPTPLEIFFQSFEQSNYAARLMAMSKPVYSAVVRHARGKPVMVFVPSRKQAQLTAIDFMTYQETQEDSIFLGEINEDDSFSKHCAGIMDVSLKQVVQAGIGYLYEGMRQSDMSAVLELYHSGKILALVCPSEICWKVNVRAYLVVLMGTEQYDGRERRHVDYSVGTLLRMMGRASRHDSEGKCLILCHSPKKEFLKKVLFEPLPVESHLDHYLHDHFNSEIVTKNIRNLQDSVDYLTWTFLYRRLGKNPNYYALQGTSNMHISEHLSDMVETVLGDLSESKCCSLDDEGNVSPLNLGMVASYYYIQYTTVELIASSVTEKTKIRGIMEILANASEFSIIPVRNGEEKTLKMEARLLRHKLPDNMQFNEWSTKTLILLQAHFSRRTLSAELLSDQTKILKQSVSVVQAIVDVISSNGWLKPALAAMELSQMIVQGLWSRDSVLKQIPHFDDEIVRRCEQYQGDPIESVFDILNLDDDVRNDLLLLSDDKMADVAAFCNNYPNVDVSYAVQDADDIIAGEPMIVRVDLEREVDEDEDLSEEELGEMGMVSSAHFPARKREGWWITVGDTSNNSLLSLKRVNLKQKLSVQLEFMAPEEPGDHELALFCMSDCYLGCDQEYKINISVAPNEGDDDDEDDED